MAAETTFTLTITSAGEPQTFTLGARHVESIVSGYGTDTPEFAGLFAAAAQHPALSVRRSAAGQDNLPADAVLALANDPCASVRVQIVGNRVFRQVATEAVVLALIESDPEVADAVANYVGQFENVDVNVLCEALSRHPDPSVRRTLANNSDCPVKWLRKFRTDPSKDVMDTAISELASRSR